MAKELARIASVVADWKGLDKQEYIDNLVRVPLLRDYDDYLRQESRNRGLLSDSEDGSK